MSETTLGALAQSGVLSLGDGYRTKQSELADAGFRIIRVADIKDGRISLDSPDFVSPSFERQIGASRATAGDVLLATKGTVGRVALMPEPTTPAVYSPQLCWFRISDPSVISSRFLAYWLQSDAFLAQSSYMQAKTDMAPYISLSDLRSTKITLPSSSEQQAIAEVLGALDDKIAANTALASTADDLVRAEYAALDSGRVRVGEVADSPRSGVDPSSVDPDDLYVGLEHVCRRRMWLSDGGRAADVSSTKSRFEPGDILFGKLRPYFHKVVGAPRSGICSTDILVVRSRDEGLSSILLAALSSDAVIEEVVAASEGTRMPRTSWRDLSAVEIRWPTSDTAPQLASRLDSIRAAAFAAVAENRALAATRDALLPQLMSGRLRVRDAEAAASEAGA
jgi:type I restriction enzyme S subunit